MIDPTADLSWQDQILYPLRGKVALVTGGSRGIGAAICRVFARRGADIVATFRTHPEEVEAIASDVAAFGRRMVVVQADVADRDAVAAALERGVDELGKIDIVVANAAVNHRFPTVDAPWDSVKRTVDVSMFGAFHTLQLGAQQILRQGTNGKMIAISSVHAEIPFSNAAAYNMAKAGINHLCRTMARELAPQGIGVNAIEPGWIDT